MWRLRWSLAVGVVVAATAASECLAPTEITLRIATDIPCASLDGVAVIVGAPGDLETNAPSAVTTMCDSTGIGTLVVTPSGVSGPVGIAVIAGTRGTPDVAAEACRAQNYSNCVVARRALSFIPHTPLTLPIELSSACRNFPCESDPTDVRTCAVINGQPQCVGALIDPKLCEGDASASCIPTADGGAGDDGAVIPDAPTPPDDAAAPGTTNAVTAGGNSTCAEIAVNAAEQWWCWGSNDAGQLSFDSGGQPITKPTHAAALDGYTHVALGVDHGCGIDSTGTVECWGANASGQLGDGTMTSHIAPATTGLVASIVQVGDDFSCALTAKQTVTCWGSNTRGQLATGDTSSTATPRASSSNLTFTGLGTGGHFACGNVGGVTECWGDNTFEQLDTQTGTMSTTVVSTGVPTTGVFAIGTQHVCAAFAATLKCWGDNDDHQASSDDAGVVLDASDPLSKKVGAAAAGSHHTCVATSGPTDGGNVMCVGDNTLGQVGNGGAQVNQLTAVSMNGFVGSLSAGYDHTCAVVAQANTVYCWGNNASGQLGDGTMTTRSTPVTVAW